MLLFLDDTCNYSLISLIVGFDVDSIGPSLPTFLMCPVQITHQAFPSGLSDGVPKCQHRSIQQSEHEPRVAGDDLRIPANDARSIQSFSE